MPNLYQNMIFWAQISSSIATILIAALTLIQSCLNGKTLNEMKISRIESVSPLLIPELGAKIKGVFDDDTSYKYDLRVDVNLSPMAENKVELTPFDITLTNIGKGPACNIIIQELNKHPVNQSDKSIRIIKMDDFKQIQFHIYVSTEDFKKELNTIKVTYEDVYGEKYEQNVGLEVDDFYQVIKTHFSRPKHTK